MAGVVITAGGASTEDIAGGEREFEAGGSPIIGERDTKDFDRKRCREELEADSDENKPKGAKEGAKCECDTPEMRKMMDDLSYRLWGIQESSTDDDDVEEDYKKQNLQMVKTALTYYNEKQGTSFKLSESIASNAIDEEEDDFDWFHANFKACDPNLPDPSDKLFFAELMLPTDFYWDLKHVRANVCEIVNLSDPGVTNHCRHCSKIYHPATGYKVGVVPEGWTRDECDEDYDD